MRKFLKFKSFALLLTGLLFVPLFGYSSAHAVSLITGLGGTAGYGDLAMTKNDDGSSNELNLPFGINFYGNTYNNFFINNNGNITFNAPVSQFTPSPFPISARPMIAPFWGDVDTRCASCGNVWVAAPNGQTTVVTWDNVGYYNQNSTPTNNFQLVLRDQGAGNFDIEFRYDRLAWTTGDASGGSGGLGGTPAQAGFDAGNLTDFFTLPGSRTAAVLDLQNTSNVSAATPGLWSFAIRQGGTPGSTPDNPLLPIITDEGFDFDFNIMLNQRIFIDPVVAIGYDYEVNAGPNFASVLLPLGIGDDQYNLVLWDGTDYTIDGGVLTGGTEHFFGGAGVDRFRILGIETSAGLDPNDGLAFVTGLTFAGAGNVQMSMNPVTFDTDGNGPAPIPEPSTVLLFATGLLGLGMQRWRKISRP